MKCNELKCMDAAVDDDDVVIAILDKLPSEFAHAASYLRNQQGDEAKTLDEVVQYLNDEAESLQTQRSQRHRRDNDAAFASKSRPNSNSGKRDQRSTMLCYNCGRQGHISRTCRAPPKDRISFHAAFMATETTYNSETWYIDSGASGHMASKSATGMRN